MSLASCRRAAPGLAMAVACALAAAPALADLAGIYDVLGRNADGSPYEGTATIRQAGDGYSVQWSVGADYSGQGQLTGDIFVVSWGDATPAFYLVMPDGELHGTWADGYAFERMAPR